MNKEITLSNLYFRKTMVSIDWIKKKVEAYRHVGQLGGYNSQQSQWGQGLPSAIFIV